VLQAEENDAVPFENKKRYYDDFPYDDEEAEQLVDELIETLNEYKQIDLNNCILWLTEYEELEMRESEALSDALEDEDKQLDLFEHVHQYPHKCNKEEAQQLVDEQVDLYNRTQRMTAYEEFEALESEALGEVLKDEEKHVRQLFF
jgi:hypothetical protein